NGAGPRAGKDGEESGQQNSGAAQKRNREHDCLDERQLCSELLKITRVFIWLEASPLTIARNATVCWHRIANLKLPFSLFLALRYLKPKRTFLSIITLISVIGVMLGVTVLILVIAVMTGFDRELRQKVIDFDAHILVTSQDVLSNWRDLSAKIRQTPGVVATAPFVQGPVIVDFEGRRLAPS